MKQATISPIYDSVHKHKSECHAKGNTPVSWSWRRHKPGRVVVYRGKRAAKFAV